MIKITKSAEEIGKIDKELEIEIQKNMDYIIENMEKNGYDPEEDGFIIYIDDNDTFESLEKELNFRKEDFENMEYINNIQTFNGKYKSFLLLYDNENGVVFYISNKNFKRLGLLDD